RLSVGEPVWDRIRNSFRKERRAVELEEVLLHHPSHEVGNVRLMNAVAEFPLEPIAVEQRHEQLKVLFFPVMRRRGHQQEVTRQPREKLPETISLGVLHLAAEERGRKLVRLVADNEIISAIRGAQLLLNVLVTR